MKIKYLKKFRERFRVVGTPHMPYFGGVNGGPQHDMREGYDYGLLDTKNKKVLLDQAPFMCIPYVGISYLVSKRVFRRWEKKRKERRDRAYGREKYKRLSSMGFDDLFVNTGVNLSE